MPPESIPLFINPTAGRGRAGRRLSTIKEILSDGGVDADIRQSGGVRDLEAQVCAAADAGASRILVAGGDGSVHEAVNGNMGAARQASLGVIPTGTGNDFAKAAGIPLDWRIATRLLADRVASDALPRKIDIGRMNERYFANGAGIGFDAKVSRIARSFDWPIGDLIYLVAVVRAMADGIITPHMKISAKNFSWDGPLTLANISNGPWVGGLFHIAPMADHADGVLDLVIAAPVSGPRILRLLPKLMRGTHIAEKEISHVEVKQLHVSVSAPVPSHLDGEVQDLHDEFEVELLRDALALL
jgi:diacylglycerol kinase (ATP)